MRQVYVDEPMRRRTRWHGGASATRGAWITVRSSTSATALIPPATARRGNSRRTPAAKGYARLAGPNGYEWGIEQGIFIIGSPETVVRQIARTNEQMGGVDVFCANFEFGRMPVEQARKALRLFGKEVLPAIPRCERDARQGHGCETGDDDRLDRGQSRTQPVRIRYSGSPRR